MKANKQTFEEVREPMYILEEDRLRSNLRLISSIAHDADIEIILAFKAYALWKTFPILREYIPSTTASSLYEARLGYEEFGSPVHTFSPAYTDGEIADISRYSSHLIFNSLTQYSRLAAKAKDANPAVSLGLRVNPEYSEVGTALYNPCSPGTRFGITADKLPGQLPSGVEGFHCHCHCESGADVFQRTLAHIEGKFSRWFPQLKWINFGGGHLMTRRDYDVDLLVSLMRGFHNRYPWLRVILEPGSAFAWQTGPLVAHVVDIVEDHGINTAILDVSFTCHMPDCLEMPYMPEVRGAKAIKESTPDDQRSTFNVQRSTSLDAQCSMFNVQRSTFQYRLGGCSCLSGDYMGYWQFDHELSVGENIIFEDMLHYTTVKTTMFNGIHHPAIALLRSDGTLEVLRRFTYDDYKSRMD